MRRILLMLTVAALIVTMLVANPATALARTQEIPLDAAKGLSKAATNSPAINPTESGEFGTESDEPWDPPDDDFDSWYFSPFPGWPPDWPDDSEDDFFPR